MAEWMLVENVKGTIEASLKSAGGEVLNIDINHDNYWSSTEFNATDAWNYYSGIDYKTDPDAEWFSYNSKKVRLLVRPAVKY